MLITVPKLNIREDLQSSLMKRLSLRIIYTNLVNLQST
jgi:hypothetical protein